MHSYLENRESKPIGALLSTLFMAVFGVGGVIMAHQIVTGWVALGARANISRHNLNFLEWGGAIVALLLGVAALRTAWGLYTRERAGWAWAQ